MDTHSDGYVRLIAALESRSAWQPFVEHVAETARQANVVQRSMANRLMDWAEQYLGSDHAEILAEGYVRFVSDVNLQQLRYEKRGHYLNRSFAEVYENTYGNALFMHGYHWGVYASTFAWRHHLDIYELFNNVFLPGMTETEGEKRILDLGCGSGLWSLLAVNENEFIRAEGVDISQTSVEESNEMARALGMADRFKVHQGDATNWRPPEGSGSFDGGISCFVLEHLEEPKRLLKNLAACIKPRRLAFVTAALTAAECDHIHEFKRESELIVLAEDAGFRVIQSLSVMPPNYRPDGRFPPRSMAMILRRRADALW